VPPFGSPWFLLALATAAGLGALGFYVWRHRATHGGGSVLLLVWATAWWVLCSGLEQVSHDLETKLILVRLAWLAIPAVPSAALVVALHACGLHRFTRRRHLAALAVAPAVLIALVWTNEHHGWIWRELSVTRSGAWTDLVTHHGPAFWAGVAYLLMAGAAALLAGRYLRAWSQHREEALLVGAALLAPWAANFSFLLSEAHTPSFDLTPYAFSVTAVCLSLALWRGHRLLTVIRVARSQILDEMSDGALVADMRGRLVYANRAAREALGLAPVVRPLPLSDALASRPELAALLRRAGEGPREISLQRGERGASTYHLRTTTLADFQGLATARILVLRDVTEYKRSEAALRDGEVLLRKIVDLVPHMIFAKDREGRYILVNRALADMRGLAAEDMLGRTPEARGPEAEERVRRLQAEDRRVIDTARPRFHPEVAWQGPGDEERSYQVTKIPFTDPRSGEPAMLGIAIDVTDRKAAEAHMRALAYHDGLTGLPNRRRFRRILERTLDAARRRGRRAALLFLDLDRFKQVNDRLGHACGDDLLQSVAERVREILRYSDEIARPGGGTGGSTLSRLGGDEFTILLADLDTPTEAAVVARRILDALARPFRVGPHEIHTTASVGIAVHPDDAQDADALFHHADQAMYAAKRQGRNGYAFYSAALTQASARRAALEEGLHGALARGELALRYQPVRHARSGQLVSAEALLRWQHPELGAVSPEEFLPVAEDTGLMVSIGEWVLRTACGQLRLWRDTDLETVLLSVNLSGFQVRQAGLLGFVGRVLEETGTSPADLELEITESTVMADDAPTRKTLSRLKALGMGFALDDFGTGWSSLSQLRAFPFDAVKIDRSFVEHVATEARDRALAVAIIDLAHALGLRVVAEGVETRAQLDVLREAGCDAVQGHLISHPLPAPELARLLDPAKPR